MLSRRTLLRAAALLPAVPVLAPGTAHADVAPLPGLDRRLFAPHEQRLAP